MTLVKDKDIVRGIQRRSSEDLVTPPPELADAEPLPELSPKSKLLSRVVPDDFKMRRKQKKHKKK